MNAPGENQSDRERPDAKNVFNDALDLPASERAAFLQKACAGDPPLRARMSRLLRVHDSVSDFLDAPTAGAAVAESGSGARSSLCLPQSASTELEALVGSVIGPYRLVERLGEGGFGEVWTAEQTQPMRRTVALKILKPGMDSREVLARFEAERQALALMDHPNVAKVFDAGSTGGPQSDGPQPPSAATRERDATVEQQPGAAAVHYTAGRPYFVMEHVPGVPLTDYCDAGRLRVRQRLELFVPICQAVQHAHTKGIIHRDLKPSNILVTLLDGKPVPKVIDFGIAKAIAAPLTDRTLHTQIGRLMGTPEYMSPEQAATSGIDVDTRSDVYSLGVILYQLLTGTLPFEPHTLRKADYSSLVKIIRELEPPKPSTRLSTLGAEPVNQHNGATPQEIATRRDVDFSALQRQVRGELDWIVMKCLEKDRARRYETTSALAADVQRHLGGEPVVAAPPSRLYRLSKTLRRHRTAAAVATSFVVLIAAGLVATGTLWRQAEHARDAESEQRARAAAVSAFLTEMLTAAEPAKTKGEKLTVREALDTAAKRIEEGPLNDQPLVEAEIRFTIGSTYIALGLYEQAEAQFRAAYALQSRELGEEHPDTLRTRGKLTGMPFLKGDYAVSAILLEPLMRVQSRVLGPDHPDTLRSRSLMGFVLVMSDRFAEGEPLLRAAVEGFRRVLGENHPETARHMDRLGDAYIYSSYPEKAEPLHREALRINTLEFGEAHPATLYSLHCVASALHNQNRLQEAEPAYRKAFKGALLVLGPEHPSTLSLQADLARVISRQGRHAEAVAMYRECLATELRIAGPDAAGTITTRRFLAACLMRQQEYPQAEGLLREALDAAVKKYGPEHGDTSIRLMCALSEALAKQRKDPEAEQVARQVLEFQYRQQPRPNLFELEQSSFAPIEVLQRRQANDDAMRIEQKLIEFLRAAALATDASAATLNSAARRLLYPRIEKLRDAPQALKLAFQANQQSGQQEPNHLRTLAQAYLLTGDSQRAKETWERAFAQLPDDQARASMLNSAAWELLTATHETLRDPAGALRFAQRVNDLSDHKNPGYLDTLALACFRTGDTPKAIEFQKRALDLLPQDSPQRPDFEARLAEFEAALAIAGEEDGIP